MTAQPRPVESPLLTPMETAAYVRMSRAWVWLHRVELGAILVGSKLRYTQAGLDAYLERQRQQPSAPDEPVQIADERERRQAAHQHATPRNPVTRRPWTCCTPREAIQ